MIVLDFTKIESIFKTKLLKTQIFIFFKEKMQKTIKECADDFPNKWSSSKFLVNCLRRFNVYDAGCLLHCNMPKLALQLIWWYNSYAQFKVWVLSGLILNDRNDCLWGTRKTWNRVEARQTQNSYGFWISCRECTKFSHNSNFDKPNKPVMSLL